MRFVLLAVPILALPANADDLGLKVPPGFRVTLWADHTLANDIFTMALDEKGRVVVSGPGYVRRLEDTDGDGKADKATDLVPTKTGAMGLLFADDGIKTDGYAVYVTADGKITGYWYDVANRRYESYHEETSKFPFSEHGGHALKVGPEARMYAIGGNDSRLNEWKQIEGTPVPRPEAGGVLRFPWRSFRLGVSEIIAHGFRNPYDFDFTPYGDIITYDSDTERDFLLPWYIPTRVYHVLPGAHHGWRLTGYTRSLGRPDYYPDTVEMLADMGRGSPTGVCCYRHTQFPAHYRGGVFLLDWTFGKVYYMPLIPEGSSYKKVKPEVFLEPTGTNGFAPTAARVGPDGSLFISIGGRGTRGAVYKVEYVGNGAPRIPPAEPASDLDLVLNAPQPLEAWSMAKWKPLADKLDAVSLANVAISERESTARRIRAIEVLATIQANFTSSFVAMLAESPSALVRARAAWIADLQTTGSGRRVLVELIEDKGPRVVVAALTSLADHLPPEYRLKRPNETEYPLTELDAIIRCMDHEDHRVRVAAARVVAALSPMVRDNLARLAERRPTSRILTTMVVADTWPGRDERPAFAELWPTAMKAWDLATTASERTDAIRAIQLAFGDWNLDSPPVELFSAYSLHERSRADGAYYRLASRDTLARMRRRFPSKDPHEDIEASRLFAMLRDDDPELVRKVQSQITDTSHPTSDFHYLTVLSRLAAPRDEAQARQVADALLGMEKKLAGRQLRIKQNWSARLGELVGELLHVYPGLDKVLASHPALVQPGHVVVAGKLTGQVRIEAARRFLTAVRTDEEFPLSAELIDLVATLPPAEFRPVLRSRWSERAMREAIVRHLADRPESVDRSRFLEVLETAPADVTQTCLSALATLPCDGSPANLVPLLMRLRQSLAEPKEGRLRKEIVDLINRQAGQGLMILESKTDAASLAKVYRPVFEWFEKARPTEAKRLNAAGEEEVKIRAMLPAMKWEAGDVERGRKFFRDRGCLACHGGSARIGPDLAGVSKRFSRDDLLTAIVNPSRDVAPAFRMTRIDLKDGKRISGIVVFESADGLIVQTGAAETRRIANDDIESRTPSPKSLMPDGLLKGIKPEELADLFAFLAKQ